MPSEENPSDAMVLMRHVWRSEGRAMGGKRSWRRLNDAMQQALRLAVVNGMKFNKGDFAAFCKVFNSGYWLNVEGAYSLACGDRHGPQSSHGPNPSAYQAIEHYLGRKPFIVAETCAADAARVRLHVGKVFDWHDNMEKRIRVKVTSFADDQKHVVACHYKTFYKSIEDDEGEQIVHRIFKITHADVAAYHKAIRGHAKRTAVATEGAA